MRIPLFRHRFRSRNTSKSLRQGGKKETSPLRRRPLTIAGIKSIMRSPTERLQKPTGFQLRSRAKELSRFPLLRLLPERGDHLTMLQSPMDFMMGLRDTLQNGPAIHVRTSICQSRGARRRVLFKTGIAGRGKRKSPGAGGSYRRTSDSEKTCVTTRTHHG